MNKQIKVRMQQRYNSSEVWRILDPVLERGEIGIESDTGKFKYGNGWTKWSQLEYAFGNGLTSIICNSIDELPSAADYPGAIAIVPMEYTLTTTENLVDENGEAQEVEIVEQVIMDTPYISLRKNNLWYWTIFADQKDAPIASSALDYFQLDVSTLG